MQRPPRTFENDETITDSVFDSILLCRKDRILIRSAIQRRGGAVDSEMLIRSFFWENPAGVQELLDHGAPVPADLVDYIQYYNKCDIFGDRDETLRTFLAHPRVNPRLYETCTECRRIAEDLSKQRIVHRTQCLKRELMEKTWAPERHVSWCLEHDFFRTK